MSTVNMRVCDIITLLASEMDLVELFKENNR